ncbi:PAS domain-containing protein [Cadophora sp. MPI-SDFR-AT-0126]|nr:PAS domain-containing protein [Leotiomycetes sp. MPI-SDFR-AT-0126]
MDNFEYQDQAKRLNELRRRSAEQQNCQQDVLSSAGIDIGKETAKDPLISSIPERYAPSGFGIIDILLQVYQRPNPQIEIGNVDSSVALVLCDSDSPDHPIVYCSEAFERLTGYTSSEILGHNCRFLQHPPQVKPPADRKVNEANELARKQIRAKIDVGLEARVHFVNYRKDGSSFTNILTVIPITWEGRNYIVGFQADEGRLYR